MKFRNRLKTALCVILSLCITVFAGFCVVKRADESLNLQADTALMAAFIAMPNASFDDSGDESDSEPEQTKAYESAPESETVGKVDTSNISKNETTYPISEVDLSSKEKLYDNISIRNTTSYTVDAESLTKDGLPFEIEDTRSAQVLIVHTHTCESYMSDDNGFYYESFYPRTTDNNSNVAAVGEAIADSLKAHGIGVVHTTVQHDYPSYEGAYDRSYSTIMSYLEKYKDIKVVLDIHRDSMTQDDMTKLKPTFTYNGKKAAQIMIMSGHDDGDGDFPMWEDNLKFALCLQNTCETMYPGMTRPMYFGDFTYNMNVNTGSLLIEVGTDANTLEEAVLSGEMLGNALSQVLQKS